MAEGRIGGEIVILPKEGTLDNGQVKHWMSIIGRLPGQQTSEGGSETHLDFRGRGQRWD